MTRRDILKHAVTVLVVSPLSAVAAAQRPARAKDATVVLEISGMT